MDDKEEIMVSVFCLTYNHEKYIRSALEGFVNQKTNFKYEVIVHDDASTDKTAEIIREYELKFPEIIKPIYQNENQYSKGKKIVTDCVLPKAYGKYIALCEGDDYWTDEKKLQLQYNYMEEHPECSLVAHKTKTLHNNGHFSDYTNYTYDTEKKCHLNASLLIAHHNYFSTNSMFFRRTFYRNNHEFLNNVAHFDYVDKIMLSMEGDVYVIPKYMSVYRSCSSGSWTERVYFDTDKWNSHLKVSIEFLEAINKYREYKFDKEIKEEIRRRTFIILCNKGNIRAIKMQISIFRIFINVFMVF